MLLPDDCTRYGNFNLYGKVPNAKDTRTIVNFTSNQWNRTIPAVRNHEWQGCCWVSCHDGLCSRPYIPHEDTAAHEQHQLQSFVSQPTPLFLYYDLNGMSWIDLRDRFMSTSLTLSDSLVQKKWNRMTGGEKIRSTRVARCILHLQTAPYQTNSSKYINATENILTIKMWIQGSIADVLVN